MRQYGLLHPIDKQHEKLYPAIRILGASSPHTVEFVFPEFNDLITKIYDQGDSFKCVGYSLSMCMTLLNRRIYDAEWLYSAAQRRDGFPIPHEGTTLRAGLEMLERRGHRLDGEYYKGWKTFPVTRRHGIHDFWWAKTVDDIRKSIRRKIPCVLGVNWYSNFNKPKRVKVRKNRYEHWLENPAPDKRHTGHAILVSGASDERGAVALRNSLGMNYPKTVWIPYEVVDRLLSENGECALVRDR